MTLDEVRGGAVYTDTNVLYMYLRADPAHLATIRTFLGRMARGDIEAFVGIPVLDELYYRLVLARVREATGRNPLDVLRDDLAGVIAGHGGVIEATMRRLVALPHLNLVGVETSDFHSMLHNIAEGVEG